MYQDDKYTRTGENAGAGDVAFVRGGVVQNAFINRVFGWMFAGLAVSGGVSWFLGTQCPDLVFRYRGAYLFLAIAEIVLVIALSAGLRKMSPAVAALLFVVFAVLNGMTLSWIFMAYDVGVLAKAFFAASGTFGAMGLIGYTTKRDLSGVGGLCSMGLIGLIIASIVNMIWYNGTADLIISWIGVLIFVGLTAWDVQKIKQLAIAAGEGAFSAADARKYAVIGALELYLDFINLFLFLLRIFGGGRK